MFSKRGRSCHWFIEQVTAKEQSRLTVSSHYLSTEKYETKISGLRSEQFSHTQEN